MRDLERIGAQLEKSGKKDKLKSIAESADGVAVSRMLDPAEVERAAKSGDGDALKSILASVLGTDEGKRLAESLKNAMK